MDPTGTFTAAFTTAADFTAVWYRTQIGVEETFALHEVIRGSVKIGTFFEFQNLL